YFDEDGSTPIGFDVELAQALADDMGVKLELVDTAWDGIFAGVDTDKYDVIMSSVSFTQDRDENYLLSEPYIANAPVLVVPKDSDIASIEETKGRTIAVQMETTADYIVQEYNAEGLGADLRQYEKVINAFDELKAGRVDSVCTDSVVAAFYLGDAASNYKTVWQSPTKEPIVMCMKKGNDTLKEKLEASLNNLRDSGKLSEICVKYFGNDDPIK
ncbi:MAG: amino acid ABC transporter substrate-binding protein, partial [Eubacterium sp.]|nr:amino acid ABC transporter substrate-binding protein [Eubacterium sp.]